MAAATAWAAGDSGADIAVLPGNWDAARLLDATATQWRRCSWSGNWLGLDYAAARAAAAGLGLRWRRVFPQLRVMEIAVINSRPGQAAP